MAERRKLDYLGFSPALLWAVLIRMKWASCQTGSGTGAADRIPARIGLNWPDQVKTSSTVKEMRGFIIPV